MEKTKKLNSHALYQELENNPEDLKNLGLYLDRYHPGWKKSNEPFLKKVSEIIKKNHGPNKNRQT